MEVFQESDTSAVIQMLPAFGRHAHVVMGYCYLFGVSPMRLKAKKLRILLTELKTLFETGEFQFEKKRYPISTSGIAEALDIVVKKNWPDCLSNHNYLKKIMIGISDREAKESGRRAERDLRKKEGSLLAGYRRPEQIPARQAEAGSVGPDDPPEHLTDEQIAENRQRVKEIMGKIGQ